jgi:hypothetical protein
MCLSENTIVDSKKITGAKTVNDFVSQDDDRLYVKVLLIVSDAFESELDNAGIKYMVDPYWTRSKYSLTNWHGNAVWFDIAHYTIHPSCAQIIENIMVRYVDLYNYLQWEARMQKSIEKLRVTFDEHFNLNYPGKTWDEKCNMVFYQRRNDNGDLEDKYVFRDFDYELYSEDECSLAGVSGAIESFRYEVSEELKEKVGDDN